MVGVEGAHMVRDGCHGGVIAHGAPDDVNRSASSPGPGQAYAMVAADRTDANHRGDDRSA